jgi:DNA repair protein RadC
MYLASPKTLPQLERPRERLLNRGAESLNQVDLWQVILGVGNKKASVGLLAQQVVKLLESKEEVGLTDLVQTDLNSVLRARVLAIIELIERANSAKVPLSSPVDFIQLLEEYAGARQEHLVLFALDGAHTLISKHLVTIGSVNQTIVHPREVYALALQARASFIVLAHNHPTGICEPSAEDLTVTRTLKEAGKIMGIQLIDHIIFTRKQHYSFAAADLL